MSALPEPQHDDQTTASIAIAWLLVFNKPFYPLYVWWVTGHGGWQTTITMISMPAFAALPYLARRNSLWVRAGIPVIGMLDTILATKLFGPAGGTELFFVPCALLTAIALYRTEWRIAVGLAAGIYITFIGLRSRYGMPLYIWTAEELSALFTLNSISVASLMAFIIWRFSRVERH